MKYKWTIIIATTLLTLTGCTSQKAVTKHQPRDWTDVYDSADEKVASFSNKRTIDYISDHVGDDAGDTAGDLHNRKLPRGSRLAYKYVMHQRHGNIKFNLFIYENRFAKVNLPIIGAVVWRLSN